MFRAAVTARSQGSTRQQLDCCGDHLLAPSRPMPIATPRRGGGRLATAHDGKGTPMTAAHGLDPVEDFANLDDPVLFPHLDEDQLAAVTAAARCRTFAPGEVLLSTGSARSRSSCWSTARSTSSTAAPAATAISRGPRRRPSSATCRCSPASRPSPRASPRAPSRPYEMNRAALQRLVASSSALGDLIPQTMTARREWLEGHDYGQIRLFGSRLSSEAFVLRDFLDRNQMPVRWHALETDEASHLRGRRRPRRLGEAGRRRGRRGVDGGALCRRGPHHSLSTGSERPQRSAFPSDAAVRRLSGS